MPTKLVFFSVPLMIIKYLTEILLTMKIVGEEVISCRYQFYI